MMQCSNCGMLLEPGDALLVTKDHSVYHADCFPWGEEEAVVPLPEQFDNPNE